MSLTAWSASGLLIGLDFIETLLVKPLSDQRNNIIQGEGINVTSRTAPIGRQHDLLQDDG